MVAPLGQRVGFKSITHPDGCQTRDIMELPRLSAVIASRDRMVM
jgi:hypothetical protein